MSVFIQMFFAPLCTYTVTLLTGNRYSLKLQLPWSDSIIILRMSVDRWIAVISLVVTIAALLFAAWAYKRGEKRRIPTIVASPSPEALVMPALTKVGSFDIFYQGEHVGKNGITTFFIYFWNDGQLPIYKSDIVAPYRIRVPFGIKVLSAIVVRSTRPILGIEVQINSGIDGEFATLDFMILEPGDGCSLQVIVDGSSDTQLSFEGSCIGSAKVRVLPSSRTYFSGPRKRFQEVSEFLKIFLVVASILFLSCGLVVTIIRFLPASSKYVWFGLMVLFGLMWLYIIWNIFYDSYKKLTDTFIPPEIRND